MPPTRTEMATVLPCSIDTHYAWSFGAVTGPITIPAPWCGFVYVEDDGGDEGFSLTIPFKVGCATSIYFRIYGGRGGTQSDRIKVYCDGVEKYSSDCAANDFDSGNVLVPAGTAQVQIVVTPNCAGGSGTYWSFYWYAFAV